MFIHSFHKWTGRPKTLWPHCKMIVLTCAYLPYSFTSSVTTHQYKSHHCINLVNKIFSSHHKWFCERVFVHSYIMLHFQCPLSLHLFYYISIEYFAIKLNSVFDYVSVNRVVYNNCELKFVNSTLFMFVKVISLRLSKNKNLIIISTCVIV